MKTNKQCFRCKATKPVSEFYANSVIKDGFSSYCKPCHIGHGRLKKLSDPVKTKAYSKKYYHRRKTENPNLCSESAKRYKSSLKENPAKYRAAIFLSNNFSSKHKRDSDVNLEFMTAMFSQSTHCKCCGIPLRSRATTDSPGQKHQDGPTVDRVDNRETYTRTNIQIICLKCNTLKSTLTIQELKIITNYVEKYSHVR